MQFIDVDLPAPFGPRSPKHSPRFISKEIPSTAHKGVPPAARYSFRRFRTTSGGSVEAIAAGYLMMDGNRNCSGGLFLRLRAIALALRGPPAVPPGRGR